MLYDALPQQPGTSHTHMHSIHMVDSTALPRTCTQTKHTTTGQSCCHPSAHTPLQPGAAYLCVLKVSHNTRCGSVFATLWLRCKLTALTRSSSPTGPLDNNMADTALRDTILNESPSGSKSMSITATSNNQGGDSDPFRNMAASAVPTSPGVTNSASAAAEEGEPSPDRPLPAKKV